MKDDFNPGKAIEDLKETIYQPDKFAQLFCNAAETQKDIDKVLKKIIKELLTKDIEAQGVIENLIKEYDKKDIRRIVKKWLGWVGAIVLSIISGCIGYFIKNKN